MKYVNSQRRQYSGENIDFHVLNTLDEIKRDIELVDWGNDLSKDNFYTAISTIRIIYDNIENIIGI